MKLSRLFLVLAFFIFACKEKEVVMPKQTGTLRFIMSKNERYTIDIYSSWDSKIALKGTSVQNELIFQGPGVVDFGEFNPSTYRVDWGILGGSGYNPMIQVLPNQLNEFNLDNKLNFGTSWARKAH